MTSYNNSVYVYDQRHNGKTWCGQITGVTNPQGLFVDKHHHLWVAIGGDCRTQFSSVLEFAPGNPTPIRTLQDPDGSATDVAVDNRSGTVYVTNFFNYSQGCASGNNGVVEVYRGGHNTPTSTLSDPNMNYAFNDAVDNRGNLYVTYLHLNGPTGSGRIDEWVGGAGSAVDLGITLQAPGGIQTTKTGALLVCDQSVACGEFRARLDDDDESLCDQTPRIVRHRARRARATRLGREPGAEREAAAALRLSGAAREAAAVDDGPQRRLFGRRGEPGGSAGDALLGLRRHLDDAEERVDAGSERLAVEPEERALLVLRIVLHEHVGHADPLDASRSGPDRRRTPRPPNRSRRPASALRA